MKLKERKLIASVIRAHHEYNVKHCRYEASCTIEALAKALAHALAEHDPSFDCAKMLREAHLIA